MVVKDDGETERVFTAEKVAPAKKNGLDCSSPCGGAPSCGGKLEQVLGQMEGVGKVSVMVTVADQGEDIIEKDKTEHTSTVTNTDSGSMEMTTERDSGEETVYEESGGEKAPYVSKEILPEIEGVLVVAEGGDSPRIVSDISDAVKALFQVEAHRIKVVKMSSKEDGT